MLPATHDQVRSCIRQYMKHGVPFRYEIQNETISIKSPCGSYTSRGGDYTIDEINFIKKVKQHVIKNEIHLGFNRPKKKIAYFLYGKSLKPGAVFLDCVNIDLTAAYWTTAYRLGIITPQIYKEGNRHRKQIRLSAIGSLAKKKRVYEFDGKKQVSKHIFRSPTDHLWDVICQEVGSVLIKSAIKCKNDFLFFWVDGIYIKGSRVKEVESMFSIHGYESKSNKIKKIEVTDRNILVDTGEKIKPFVFRSTMISRKFLGYNSDL